MGPDGDEVYPQAISKLSKISETVRSIMERYSSSLSSNFSDLSSVCDLVGVCPARFTDQIHIFSLTLGHVECLIDVLED